MKRELITRRSEALDKDMSLIVYGEGGYPVIAFQAQDSKCNAFEDFGMVEALADFIDSGAIQLFSVDNNDEESWSDTNGDKEHRAERQEDYFRFVTNELVPLVHELNGSERRPLTIGCSMGATHAALAALRRPDLFQGCIALSGVYDARYFFGDWMDGTLYENSIVSFLPNMPADHPYVELYGKRQIVLCVGQGAWEDQGIADLRIIADAVHDKGIDAWCDFWGYDVNHDWPWWKKQAAYFLPIVLDDMNKTLAEEAKAADKPTAKARRTVRKAAATAKATTKRATGATKRAAAKATAGAKAATDKVKADADKAGTDIEEAVTKTKAAAKRTATRAKAGAKKVENDAEQAVTKVKTTARKTGSAAKSTATKAAAAAKATTKRVAEDVESAAEKVADNAKQATTTAKAKTRKAAGTARTAARKTAAKAEAELEKAADEAEKVVKRATRRTSTKKSAEE